MPKLIIDKEKCMGFGVCVSLCPQMFKLNNEGKSEVIDQNASCDYQKAIDSCPTQAISLEE
jgi:ferredoxin